MLELIAQWLTHIGLDEKWSNLAARGVFTGVIVLLRLLADFIARGLVVRSLSSAIRHSSWRWDDALLRSKVLILISHFAQDIVI